MVSCSSGGQGRFVAIRLIEMAIGASVAHTLGRAKGGDDGGTQGQRDGTESEGGVSTAFVFK